MLTYSDHLTVIKRGLHPSVFSSQTLEETQKLCSLFPFHFANDFGFETRLGNPDPVCDFFLQIRRGERGDGFQGENNKKLWENSQLQSIPGWKRLVTMLTEWEKPGTLLHDKVSQFWLEFDYQGTTFNPIPNVFFQVTEDSGLPKERQISRLLQVLDSIYRLLFDIPFPENLTSTMKNTMEMLPSGSLVYQVGFMIPRKTEALQLVLTRMRSEAMMAFLEAIVWPGELPLVNAMIERYVNQHDYAVFNLYIGERVLSFLGIELYFNNLAQPDWEPRWKKVFRLLEEDGLMLPEKKEGLLSYCGKTKRSFIVPLHYFNGINHFKLVYKKGCSLECKAYFGTMIRIENHI